MAKEIKLPQISEGVASAQVAEVLVSVGDIIEKEQSIIAVETDKASVEVPSTDSGKVKEIKVKEGDEIKVGDVILILEEEEREADKEAEGAGAGAKEEKKDEVKTEKQAEEPPKKEEQQAEKPEEMKEEPKKAAAKPEEEEETEQEEEAKAEKERAEEEEEKKQEKKDEPEKAGAKEPKEKEEVAEVPAAPGVRRLAREMGVDLQAVTGSGEAGRITEEDIKAHAGKQPSLPDFSQWGEVERKPLSNIRKAIAERTAASWHAIPHVTHFDEADITGIEEYRKENSKKTEAAGGKLTITAILVKIAANALQRFSMLNASIDTEKGEVILKKYIHIGIAVDTEKGLLVPVIRDADKKSLLDLAVEITALSGKARDQQLSPEEMQGGNFVVSNLGGIGGTNFTPIVYHPQVAILGVSKAKWQPVYLEGVFVPRQVLPLSLSYDHRLIDGAEGARFLRWIGQALEDPYKALLEG